MNDARKFYGVLKAYLPSDEKVFCDLHECGDPNSCDKHQSREMMNFDDIKVKYCKDDKSKPCSSVDAVTYNEYGVFFLIEAKSWENYYKHQHPMLIIIILIIANSLMMLLLLGNPQEKLHCPDGNGFM